MTGLDIRYEIEEILHDQEWKERVHILERLYYIEGNEVIVQLEILSLEIELQDTLKLMQKLKKHRDIYLYLLKRVREDNTFSSDLCPLFVEAIKKLYINPSYSLIVKIIWFIEIIDLHLDILEKRQKHIEAKLIQY